MAMTGAVRTHKPTRIKGQRLMIVTTLGSLITFYSLFLIFPIIYAFVGSFHDWLPQTRKFDFIGLDNYRLIFSQDLTWLSLRHTIIFTFFVTVIRTGLGLFFAVLINDTKRIKTYLRTTFFIPVITSTVAVSMVWKWILDPAFGPVNHWLYSFGLPEFNFLKDPNMALGCIMAMTIWKDMGYALVIFLAGITGIPSTLYEAAYIDGASGISAFRYITVPLLRPTTLFVVVTSIIAYCQSFTQIYMMTKGGPGTATHTTVYQLFYEGFTYYQFGKASALSFLLFVVILFFSLIQLKMNQSDWGF